MLPEEAGHFDWSNSGLELLSRIKRTIHEYGGTDWMATLIIRENPEFFGKAPKRPKIRRVCTPRVVWSKEQDEFIKAKWNTLGLGSMGKILKRTVSQLSKRGRALRLPPKKHIQLPNKFKKVA